MGATSRRPRTSRTERRHLQVPGRGLASPGATVTHGTLRPMTVWLTLAVNSIALGGLLFLLSSGFSLIFGLMRIPNLMHGSFFMLGAYFGVTMLDQRVGLNFWLAAL